MSGRSGRAGTTHGASTSTPAASSSTVATSAVTTSPAFAWIARKRNDGQAVQLANFPRRESAVTISAQTPWIQTGVPAVVLAPMEGVTDASMRALLSELGGFTFCVAEFFRISQAIPGAPIFRKHVPELA